MQIERLSEDFWRILGVEKSVRALGAEVVRGLGEVGIYGSNLEIWMEEPQEPRAGRTRRVPVVFESTVDAERICQQLGISFHHLVNEFCEGGEVLAVGFQPGFPYVQLPAELHGIPRLESPRKRVPAGSVAMVEGTWGIYPAEVPGGWNIIGSCPRKIVDVDSGYFPIRAGDHLIPYPVERGDGIRWLLPVDLNVDLGEGFPWDEALMELATSINICMGAHAGSSELTRERLKQGRERGLKCIAHPGYPDREGMGRRSGQDPDWILSVKRQLEEAGEIGFDGIKPHGALYHDLLDEFRPITLSFTKWLADSGLPLVGLEGTHHEKLADEAEVRFVTEGFVERGYRANGTLVPRGETGAEISEPEAIRRQAVKLALRATETLCVHGDREGCVEILRETRNALVAAEFEVGTWS